MDNNVLNKRNTAYSPVEEEFYRSCAKMCEELTIHTRDLANVLSPLVGRTNKALELRIGTERRTLKSEQINHTPVSASSSSSSIQVMRKQEQDTVSYFGLGDVGKKVKVKVKDIKPYGAFCQGENGKVGLIVKSMISDHFVKEVSDFLQPGDEFYALVIPDKERPGKALLNAKALGNIVAIKERRRPF